MISFGTPPSTTFHILHFSRTSTVSLRRFTVGVPDVLVLSLSRLLIAILSFFWFVVFVLISAQLSVRRSVSIFLASDPIRQAPAINFLCQLELEAHC
jgi:hypothetical protein